MKEASKTKFYVAKYFFLVIGMLQWLVALLLASQARENLKLAYASLLFISLGLIFLTLQGVVAAKLKRVALGKKKIAIIERTKTRSYKWPDVKSIRLIPFFNLYSMKLKGKKEHIYFLPTKSTPSVFGMFASNEFADKAKN